MIVRAVREMSPTKSALVFAPMAIVTLSRTSHEWRSRCTMEPSADACSPCRQDYTAHARNPL